MSKLTIPKNYSSALNLHDTQLAIKTVKDFFQGMLAQRLSQLKTTLRVLIKNQTKKQQPQSQKLTSRLKTRVA